MSLICLCFNARGTETSSAEIKTNPMLQQALSAFLNIPKMQVLRNSEYEVILEGNAQHTSSILIKFIADLEIPPLRLRVEGKSMSSRIVAGVQEILIPHSLPTRWNFKPGLLSHPLHPYVAHPQFPLIPREAQVEALTAYRTWFYGDKKILNYVSPTGTGKTNLLSAGIKVGIQAGQTVFVVVTDSVDLLKQNGDFLTQELKGLADVEVFYQNNPLEIDDFKKGSRPRVLVCSAWQFRKIRGFELYSPDATHVKPGEDIVSDKSLRSAAELGKRIDLFFYDEGHHSSAPIAGKLLDAMLGAQNGRMRFVNVSAVPLHASHDVLTRFAEHGATTFYAYINRSEDFRAEHSEHLDVEILFEQLAMAIREGDIQPLHAVNLISPTSLNLNDLQTLNFYTQVDGGLVYEINPDYYPQLINFLQTPLIAGKRGLIVASSIKEAERISKELAKSVPHLKFAAYHSRLEKQAPLDDRPYKSRQETLAAMQRGDLDYLVIVDSLREGVNLQGVSHIVDLRPVSSPGMFLNTLGRAVRLENGKAPTRLTAAYAIDAESILNNMDFYYSLAQFLDNPNVWTRPIPGQREITDRTRTLRQLTEAIAIADSWTTLIAKNRKPLEEPAFLSLDHRGEKGDWVDKKTHPGWLHGDESTVYWNNFGYYAYSTRRLGEFYSTQTELLQALSKAKELYLDPREQEIFDLWEQNLSPTEIAPRMRTTRERIHQIVTSIKRTLIDALLTKSDILLGRSTPPLPRFTGVVGLNADNNSNEWIQEWERRFERMFGSYWSYWSDRITTGHATFFVRRHFMPSDFKDFIASYSSSSDNIQTHKGQSVEDIVNWTLKSFLSFFPDKMADYGQIEFDIAKVLGVETVPPFYSDLTQKQKGNLARELYNHLFKTRRTKQGELRMGLTLNEYRVFQQEEKAKTRSAQSAIQSVGCKEMAEKVYSYNFGTKSGGW